MNRDRKFENQETDQKFSQDNNKVDYTFMYRHEVDKLIEKLLKQEHDMEELQAVAKRMHKMEEHVYRVISERFRKAEAQEANVLSQVLMMMENKQELGDNLFGMLFDPQIPDRNKNYLLKVMDFLGFRPEVFSYNEVFNDPERAIREARQTLIRQIGENSQIIPQVLSEMIELSPATQDTLMEDLAREEDTELVPFLESIAYLDERDLALKAVKILGEQETPEGKAALRQLGNDMDRQFLHQEIHREINRLTMKGIEDLIDYRSFFDKELAKLGEFYEGAVSQIDGHGNRIVTFARRWGKSGQGVVVVNFMLNLDEGVRDCWGYHKMSIEEYRGLIKEYREDGTIMSIDSDYARSIFCDALYANHIKGNQRPPEFAFWRHFMTPEWLKEESYTPYLEDDIVKEVLAGSKSPREKDLWQLHNQSEFQEWFLHHPYIYELMDDFILRQKEKDGTFVPIATQEGVETIYSKIIEELIAPNLEYYKKALLMAADFNKKRGRAKVYRTAVLAIMRMGDGDLETLKKHPFFIGLGKRSLNVAATNLKRGLDLRKNPEDFDL
ncbi:hypothetical protein [Natranaerobius thermophilus]|uniref:Uncharacterized protein n=1 Tax=Natranaerobius thermophilus (strain ATCC BAA-1301 / DSM 18059 / JW/NM-WN-LF) TaxID=457570 RepID=B2A8M5_NATTJ|nr:hypothetical protein [Natranaerobius thermophilus]ACB85909.1 hypothetical protein Nther_2344 [Natranaerobius thermophilus JW/NM-WN-LF]